MNLSLILNRLLFLSIILFSFLSLSAAAQTSILLIPSTDTQEKKKLFISFQSFAHFDKYEKGGVQSYGTNLAYGLSRNLEIGVNYYFAYSRDKCKNR